MRENFFCIILSRSNETPMEKIIIFTFRGHSVCEQEMKNHILIRSRAQLIKTRRDKDSNQQAEPKCGILSNLYHALRRRTKL